MPNPNTSTLARPEPEDEYYLSVWQRDDSQWEWLYKGPDAKHGNHYDPCATKDEAVEQMYAFIEEET